jgi:glycyl-tRNA synthetase beta chain
MTQVKPQVESAFASGNFSAALLTLAALREQVDQFFNDVMVNADDVALKNNRLALLAQLHGMLNQVADISKLAA